MPRSRAVLSDPVRKVIAAHDIIVFDGECVLCSGFFRFVLRHDTEKRFRFVTAQSALGQAMYRDLGLATDEFETNLVITHGRIYERMDAFAAAMQALGWPWRALSATQHIPDPLKSWSYDRIARNRYRLFGRYDTCMVPTPEVSARFLDLTAPE